jgi:membrane associated rhomboid family serine protease
MSRTTRVVAPVTSAFLHASVLHIGFNMFALWVIGRPVEQYLGRSRYIGLYLVSGLAGAAERHPAPSRRSSARRARSSGSSAPC